MKVRQFLGILAAGGSLAVAAYGQETRPPGGSQEKKSPGAAPVGEATAIVYFFRYTEWHGNIVEPSVYCDGIQLARLDNGRYFAVRFDPGEHTCKSNHKESTLKLALKAGEIYYVRMEMELGVWKSKGRLVPIGKARGPIELRKLQALSPEKIKDKTRVIVDLPPPDSP